MLKKLLYSSVLFVSLTSLVNATTVVFNTSQGEIEVNLFDQTTPKTVANFLQYVDDNHYTNSVIHRVAPNFIVQGGGFEFTGDWPLTSLEANSSVINEPIYSNVKGTIAMAKNETSINSATNQWFFNLKDNSQNLDLQNGGFTVFGQVINGMDIIEKIERLDLCFKSNDGSGIPVVKDENQTCDDLSTVGIENFVLINQITIIDSSEVTDADLSPVKNTLITAKEPNNSSSSGGTFAWCSLLLIGLLTLRKIIPR